MTIASDEAKEEETIQYLVLPASAEAAVLYFHLIGIPQELPIIDEYSHVRLFDSDNLTIEVNILDDLRLFVFFKFICHLC